jgi:hypothetical protein
MVYAVVCRLSSWLHLPPPFAQTRQQRLHVECHAVVMHTGLLQMLLDAKADIEERCADGWTPLMLAAQVRGLADACLFLYSTIGSTCARDRLCCCCRISIDHLRSQARPASCFLSTLGQVTGN